jgi:hypothetical protein
MREIPAALFSYPEGSGQKVTNFHANIIDFFVFLVYIYL